MKIFLIGPGGVGKTAAGRIVAEKLGLKFVDLDTKFSEMVGNITDFINTYGYESYCYDNSKLFFKLLADLENENVIFVLSSGFLVHEGFDCLTAKHIESVKNEGISVLFLPSENLDESMEIVVKRQMSRGFDLNENKERKKFVARFNKYREMGDVKVCSKGTPQEVAEAISKAIVTNLSL